MSIKSEILGIAQEHGYEGSAQTITGAINALTDTLAGSDVAGGRTVASAIHALGPYIGAGGGGGGEIGAGVGFSIQDSKWSAVTPYFMGIFVDELPVLSIDNWVPSALPSGYTYTIGLPAGSEISSVKLTQSGVSQDLQYTTTAAPFGVSLEFSVPFISFEDGYGQGGSFKNGVFVQLA